MTLVIKILGNARPCTDPIAMRSERFNNTHMNLSNIYTYQTDKASFSSRISQYGTTSKNMYVNGISLWGRRLISKSRVYRLSHHLTYGTRYGYCAGFGNSKTTTTYLAAGCYSTQALSPLLLTYQTYTKDNVASISEVATINAPCIALIKHCTKPFTSAV